MEMTTIFKGGSKAWTRRWCIRPRYRHPVSHGARQAVWAGGDFRGGEERRLGLERSCRRQECGPFWLAEAVWADRPKVEERVLRHKPQPSTATKSMPKASTATD